MTMLSSTPTRSASDADVLFKTDVLFKEAHQRRRRRRIFMATVAVAVIAATTSAVALTGSSRGQARPPVAASPLSHPAVQLPGTPPRVAWVDYQGDVHIGSLETNQQRIVASGAQDPVTSMVVSGSKLFWVAGNFTIPGGPMVMEYDTGTGRVRPFASGDRVFNAVGSTDVFVDAGDPDSFESLARYTLQGRLIQRFTYPGGWYLPDTETLGTSSLALAHGAVLVQTLSAQLGGHPSSAAATRLAVWAPATGSIRVLGDMWSIVATYTDVRTAKSLVAWLPYSCEASLSTCPLQLTDAATGVTRQIRNPLGLGFDMRGAFSPDGRRLAAFAMTNPGNYNPETRLALLNVATGTLRTVPGVTISIGESIAWAQWLHDSRQLVAGGLSGEGSSGRWEANHFLVDSATLRSTPFSFLNDRDLDVNYSAVLLP